LARRYSDRKALSPVISTLLMISATITMFVILFAGFVPSITLTQSQANIWYAKQGDAARERIAIEMIVFNASNADFGQGGQSIDVYVRNVQDIEVKITGIFINSSLQKSDWGFDQTFIYSAGALGLPRTVYVKTASASATLRPVVRFEVRCFWNTQAPAHALYDIKVVTARGNDAVYRALAP